RADWSHDEDMWVVVAPEHAWRLCSAIADVAGIEIELVSEGSSHTCRSGRPQHRAPQDPPAPTTQPADEAERPKDVTAAERQRRRRERQRNGADTVTASDVTL